MTQVTFQIKLIATIDVECIGEDEEEVIQDIIDSGFLNDRLAEAITIIDAEYNEPEPGKEDEEEEEETKE